MPREQLRLFTYASQSIAVRRAHRKPKMSFKFSVVALAVLLSIVLQVNSYDAQFGNFFSGGSFDQLSGFLSAKFQSIQRTIESKSNF